MINQFEIHYISLQMEFDFFMHPIGRGSRGALRFHPLHCAVLDHPITILIYKVYIPLYSNDYLHQSLSLYVLAYNLYSASAPP